MGTLSGGGGGGSGGGGGRGHTPQAPTETLHFGPRLFHLHARVCHLTTRLVGLLFCRLEPLIDVVESSRLLLRHGGERVYQLRGGLVLLANALELSLEALNLRTQHNSLDHVTLRRRWQGLVQLSAPRRRRYIPANVLRWIKSVTSRLTCGCLHNALPASQS